MCRVPIFCLYPTINLKKLYILFDVGKSNVVGGSNMRVRAMILAAVLILPTIP